MQTTIWPLALIEDTYRDWEGTVDGEDYLILDENGAWEVRQLVHNGWRNDWQLIGEGSDVTRFLTQHGLQLAGA